MVKEKKLEVKSCSRCRKIYEPYLDSPVCPLCYDILNKQFKRVKLYIRQNEHAGIEEIADICAVPSKQLIRWVREERLFFSETSDVSIPCLECGESIRLGKYCEPCKRKIDRSLREVKAVYVEKNDRVIVKSKSTKRLRFGDDT